MPNQSPNRYFNLPMNRDNLPMRVLPKAEPKAIIIRSLPTLLIPTTALFSLVKNEICDGAKRPEYDNDVVDVV